MGDPVRRDNPKYLCSDGDGRDGIVGPVIDAPVFSGRYLLSRGDRYQVLDLVSRGADRRASPGHHHVLYAFAPLDRFRRVEKGVRVDSLGDSRRLQGPPNLIEADAPAAPFAVPGRQGGL